MRGGKQEDDWGSESQSLFQAGRFDHEPSQADKARVQEAIALRLSERANEAAGIDQAGAGLGQRASQLIRSLSGVRLALGAVFLAGVSTLSLQVIERPKPQAPVDSAVSASSSDGSDGTTGTLAAPSSRSAQQRAAPLAGNAPPTGSLRSEGAPLQRAALPRPQLKTRYRTRAVAASAATPAAESRRASSETAGGVEAKVAVVADSAPRSEAAERPLPMPATPVVTLPNEVSARPAPAADARAELTLVERIQAALRVRDSSLVLALCDEHERRWPHGTFVQEREGIRALISCSSGAKNADRRARVFLAAHPDTPLAYRVASACDVELSATTSAPTDPEMH